MIIKKPNTTISITKQGNRSSVYKKRSGYVYIFECAGLYKIGCTSHEPEQRAKTLQLPWPVTIIYSIFTSDSYGLEAHLHTKYDEYWVNGEWYNLKDVLNTLEETIKKFKETPEISYPTFPIKHRGMC